MRQTRTPCLAAGRAALALCFGWLALLPRFAAAQTCDSIYDVGGGQTYPTIQLAIDALPATLTDNPCVVLRDAGPFNEQVSIRNKASAGFGITIMKDSALGSRPVVNPPASSTAAFVVENTSVAIKEVNIIPTSSVSYGIYSSSDNVKISSVGIFDSGSIGLGGVLLLGNWGQLSYSTVSVQNPAGLEILSSSSHTVWQSYFFSAAYHAVLVNTNSSQNLIQSSTMTAAGAGTSGLKFTSNSFNSVVQSYISNPPGGRALAVQGADHITVDNCVIRSSAAAEPSAWLLGAGYSTITQSYLLNEVGEGLAIHTNSVGNVVSLSTITNNTVSANEPTLEIVASSSNTITGSYIFNQVGSAVIVGNLAPHNSISRSTMIASCAGCVAFMVYQSSAVSVSESFIYNSGGTAAYVQPAASYITISLSTMVGSSYGLATLGASSVTVTGSYIQGATGANINGSTATTIGSSILEGIDPTGNALWITNSSLNISIASSTLKGGGLAAALHIDRDNEGAFTLSSNTVRSGSYGLFVSTQASGLVLSVSSLTFASLSSGATAIFFDGGIHIATFTNVSFADANIAVNVNARPVSPASRITMRSYSGIRGGPLFENDPTALVVNWITMNLPSGCAEGFNVKQDGSAEFTAIQPAINSLSSSLAGDTCVVVRDTQTYVEQIDIRGFTTNGFRLKVLSDPSFISSAPVLSPPALSTAAFWIRNSSVTIERFMVLSTSSINYGVRVSSDFARISSITVNDASGLLTSHAIALFGDWTVMTYSSVAVTGPNSAGVYIFGNHADLSFIRAWGATSSGFAGMDIWGSSNTVDQSFVHGNPAGGNGLQFNSAADNTVSRSTITALFGGSEALKFNSSSRNTVSQSYLYNPAGRSVHFNGTQDKVILSTIAANSSFHAPVQSAISFSGLIDRCLVQNLDGDAVQLWGANGLISNFIINRSMVISANGYGVNIGASSASIISSYIQGSTAVFVLGSTGTVISDSVIVATLTAGSAVWVDSGSVNVSLTSSSFQGGSQAAAIRFDRNNSGSISITSSAVRAGRYGLSIATQTAGTIVFVSSLNFNSGLTSGATAIQFLGGSFASTFTYVNFTDPSIAVNVNGAPLAPASRITMIAFSGARAGPSFESDPSNLVVHWSGILNTSPGSPAVAQVDGSSITVSFVPDGADAYILRGSTAANLTGTLFFSSRAAQVTSLALNNLAFNTTYFMEVGSLWSATTFYAALSPTATLSTSAAPVAITNITATSFRASWNQNGNPAGTVFQISLSTDVNHAVIWSSGTTTAFFNDYTSLLNDATYFFRVRSENWAGTPSPYALGAVVTRTGVVTISANRLPGVWYNVAATLFNAQGANSYLYSISSNPNDIPGGPDSFSGASLSVPMPSGTQYFHVIGVGGLGDGQVAHFGPIFTDFSSPAILTMAAQKSVTDATPIADGATTIARTPYFTWPVAVSVSPVAGYSFAVSTSSLDVPGQTVNIPAALTGAAYVFNTAGRYYAKVRALNLAGTWSAPTGFTLDFTIIPGENGLQIRKNFFNATRGECMSLDILAAAAGRIRLDMYNPLGRKVLTLANQDVGPGGYSFSWCGRNESNELVATGVYFLRIEAPGIRKDLKIGVAR